MMTPTGSGSTTHCLWYHSDEMMVFAQCTWTDLWLELGQECTNDATDCWGWWSFHSEL